MQQKRRENKKNRKTLIRHYKILSYRRVPNCIEDDTSPIRIEFKSKIKKLGKVVYT